MSRPPLPLALTLLFALSALASPAAADSAEERLHRAQIAYLEMEFDQAISILDEGIAGCEGGGCSPDAHAALHLMRGTVALAARGDEASARREFERGLELNEDAALDLNYATPQAEEVFIEVRERFLAERPPREETSLAEAPTADAAPPGMRRRVVKWNRGFVEAGYSLTMATAHSNMRAASSPTLANPGDDPQLDAIPENDSFVLSGTRGCDAPAGEYCVRMTDGRMAFAHGIHLGGGYFITERFALGGRLRLNPAAGSGAMSHLLLGLRAYVQLTEPKQEGFHALVYGGVMAGQIQVRPRQEPTDPGGDVARPWVRTGLGGFEVGAKLVHRVKPNVGLFAAPELYALFPNFSFGVQATVGVDFTFGEAEHVVLEPIETAPAAADEDGDGIPDDRDRCPGEPEDFDGFEDEDGCPDLDNDGDGIPDERDRCPREPEDFDGFEDEDGCPDRDNDGDGVFDDEDECPNEPGPALNEGCPIPDRDGDGVADRFDNCPDEPGSPENMGCPIPQLVQIEEKRIKILDSIYFQRNGHVIDRRSYELLDQLASVVREHPEIAHVRIEGHTDSTGSAKYNRKLSQRRAESVLRYLVERGGVESHRLSAHGFGPDRPIHPDADTEEEHAENRRVEFVTLTE